jgi:hypothetical protein
VILLQVRALLMDISFGWAADNLWPVVTSLIFTPIVNEFAPGRPPLLQLAQNIGLLVGAMFWGQLVPFPLQGCPADRDRLRMRHFRPAMGI